MQSLWMLAASFFFAIMGMFIKLSSSYHNLGEIVLFRGLPSVIFILGYALRNQLLLFGHNLKTHARRNMVGITSMWMGFYGTTHLPLSTATTLNYTSPLFIAIFAVSRLLSGHLAHAMVAFRCHHLGLHWRAVYFQPICRNGFKPHGFASSRCWAV